MKCCYFSISIPVIPMIHEFSRYIISVFSFIYLWCALYESVTSVMLAVTGMIQFEHICAHFGKMSENGANA